MDALPEICMEREYRDGQLFRERYLVIGNNGKMTHEVDSLKDLSESLRYFITSGTIEEGFYRNKVDVVVYNGKDAGYGVVVKIRKGLGVEQLKNLAKSISMRTPK